jgi:predicted PurR-regulated permease PerM
MSFCADSFIFFSVLHYLIISKSGGVMQQVLGMLPLSESTRTRCAVVLDQAVSSVLLATVKAAFFQATFTWLLFRLLGIHFLYMATLLAFFSAILPLIPTWWSSIPAVAQLALEGQYIQAIILMGVHIGLMDYSVGAIQSGIPGNNAYLTGLSIAGGMALFSSTLEVSSLPSSLLCKIPTKYTFYIAYHFSP